MDDLVSEARAWAVRGKLLQPYVVKPLLRDLADEIERLRTSPLTTERREAAWRDGWAECKARLTEDEAFYLTEDVEDDAWLDSQTRAALIAGPVSEGERA